MGGKKAGARGNDPARVPKNLGCVVAFFFGSCSVHITHPEGETPSWGKDSMIR